MPGRVVEVDAHPPWLVFISPGVWPGPAQNGTPSALMRESIPACLTHARTDSTPQPNCPATRLHRPKRPAHPRLQRADHPHHSLLLPNPEYRRVLGFPPLCSNGMNSVLDLPRPKVSKQPRTIHWSPKASRWSRVREHGSDSQRVACWPSCNCRTAAMAIARGGACCSGSPKPIRICVQARSGS